MLFAQLARCIDDAIGQPGVMGAPSPPVPIGDAQKGPTGADEIGDVSASLYKSAAGPAAVAPAAPSVTADEDGVLRRIGSTGSMDDGWTPTLPR